MSGLTVNFLKDNFFGFMWMRGLWLTPLISCTVHCPMHVSLQYFLLPKYFLTCFSFHYLEFKFKNKGKRN